MKRKEYMQPTMDVVKIEQSQMLCVSQIVTIGLDDDLIPGGSGDIGGALAPGMTIPGLELIPGDDF
jgi:hypothetical protein